MKVASVSLLFAAAGCVQAQSLEPRFYSNTPVGMNFALAGYTFSTGGVTADPSVQLENGDIDAHGPFAAYARSMALWDRSAKFDMSFPYIFLSGSATVAGTYVSRDVDGFADPMFRFSINWIGAPALRVPEFGTYRQDFVLGTSLKVTAPLGQYDTARLVNIGTHRWSFTPELGMSKIMGPLILEVAAAASLFTENDEFNGQTKEQDPIYSLQAHLVYSMGRGFWIALDATGYAGGRTVVGGVKNSDLQQNSRVGVTLACPVSRAHSIKLYGSRGVSTRTGSDFDTIGAAWQYRWGGGLMR